MKPLVIGTIARIIALCYANGKKHNTATKKK